MTLCYLDTSALVKLYVQEPGTERMLSLVQREEGHALALLALARIELRSAVRRRQRQGDISGEASNDLLMRFERHFSSRYIAHPVTEAVLDQALGVLDRHDLRAYDALQLSGCLALQSLHAGESVLFVCSDSALLEAAAKEDLQTLDPTRG